jgi:hypothetical protein
VVGVLLAVLAAMTLIAALASGIVTIPVPGRIAIAISFAVSIGPWAQLGTAVAVAVWAISRRASESE